VSYIWKEILLFANAIKLRLLHIKIKKKIYLFNKNLERAIQAVAIREVLGQYFTYEIIYADQLFVLLLLLLVVARRFAAGLQLKLFELSD